jgi:hypothetical protein
MRAVWGLLRTLWGALRVLVWTQRLRLAKQYYGGLDDLFRMERQRAEADVAHCETMLARSRMSKVEGRADARLQRRVTG